MTALVLLLTLWPLPEQSYRASLSPVTCLVCGDQGVQDVIQNVLMLLPLGLALGLAGIPPARALLIGFVLSLTVESLQFWVITGRDASLSDLLTNTLGTWLGATLARHLPFLLHPGPTSSRRLAALASVTWSALWCAGAWLIGNHPGYGAWRGRVANDFPDVPALSGEVLCASLNGASLAVAPAALPPEVERTFAGGRFLLDVTLRPAVPMARRENVATVIDDRGRGESYLNHVVLVLNRAREHAVVVFRMNAATLRLRTPTFAFGPLFRPGEEVHLQVERQPGWLEARWSGQGSDAGRAVFRLGPELLYSAVAPRSPGTSPAWHVESLLWAAMLLGAAGYWSGRAGIGSMVAALALAVATQVVVPLLFPVAPQSLLGWTMLLGGLLLGALAGRRTRHPVQ